jgi:signal transduction histidine kinase
LVKQDVSLGEIANEAMNLFIEPAQAKKISIEDSVPEIHVAGDDAGLTQVVSILLDNAIKYSNGGGTIHLVGEKKAGFGYLKVKDNGPGMRASDVPHIFERFYRADNSRSREGDTGYGLGLSIAKQIIDQHDGEIIATSTLSEGSTFTIKLPLADV